MAEKLEQIYRIVEEKTGLKGRMRLVVKTGIPKNVAQMMIDDPEVVERFKSTASAILGHDINDYLQAK